MNLHSHKIGIFKLMMIAIVSVDSIRNLPIAAQYGTSLITFYLIAGIAFFLPLIIVTHFLADRYPKTGGSYLWIQDAFGSRWGLVSVWLQWIYNIIWYPTIFAFISVIMASFLGPVFENSKGFILILSLLFFWGITINACFGIRNIGRLSTASTLIGTFIPMGLIIILAIYWLLSGHPSATPLSWQGLIPTHKNMGDLGFFNNILFSLLGIEMIAMHAGDVENPRRTYSHTLIYSGIIILASLIFSSLALCIVIPSTQIGLIGGVMQAFNLFFTEYHMPWASTLIGIAIVFGGLGIASSWISGLARGLHVASFSSTLPLFFRQLNRHHMPRGILILQAIVFTLLCSVFLLFPDIQNSYWLLSSMTAQFALLYYVLLFAAAFKLFYRDGKLLKRGIWLILGILVSLTGITIGFMPPASLIAPGAVFHYELLICLGSLAFLLPLVFLLRKQKTSP